jgi:hypothetical protein
MPDGSVWFDIYGDLNIGVITPQGTLLEFPLPPAGRLGATAQDLTYGPDGNVWFLDPQTGRIGRVTAAGIFTTYALPMAPGAGPQGLTVGPDGALWFTGLGSNLIGRITVDGSLSEYRLPGDGESPMSIATGPDGNLWLTATDSRETDMRELIIRVIPSDLVLVDGPTQIEPAVWSPPIAAPIGPTGPTGVGGPTGVTGVAAPSGTTGPLGATPVTAPAPLIAPAQSLVTRLRREIASAIMHASLAALRRHHSITFTFLAPGAGTVAMRWIETSMAGHKASGTSRRALVAFGSHAFRTAGTARVRVRLTAAGIRLTISARFSAVGGPNVVASRALVSG